MIKSLSDRRMNIDYTVLKSLNSKDNDELIQYLDKILNHRVNASVWDWEFNTIKDTIFTTAKSGNEIAGTQSMLPIQLSINGRVIDTAKSETSYLDANFRGKQIFEKLYQLAVDKTVESGSKLIWGFTPALKAWKKNLAFETFDSEMQISKMIVGYYSFLKNKHKSRNAIFAIGKYFIQNGAYVKYKLLQSSKLKFIKSITALTELKRKEDLPRLYQVINTQRKGLIHLDMNESYILWRIKNNPVLKYQQCFFYDANQLVGYVLYTIKEDTLIIADITWNLDAAVLRHMLKYIVNNNTGFYQVQYWANVSNEINKEIFQILSDLGAKATIDGTRNFVYKIFDTEHNNDVTNKLENWYMNGLWTEGFHI